MKTYLKSMKKSKKFKIALIVLIITTCVFMISTIADCIKIYNDRNVTSAPWTVGIIVNSAIFAVPIIVEIIVLIIFYKK